MLQERVSAVEILERALKIKDVTNAERGKLCLRAVACWTDLIPTYGTLEEDLVRAAKNNVLRLQPLARKHNGISVGSMDDGDSKDSISLDE